MQIGLTIKDWSRDKSQRDMKSTLPDFNESNSFNEYLEMLDEQMSLDPSVVVPMKSTRRETTLLMQY